MSIPADPIEGYYAQQSAPGARELLRDMEPRDTAGMALAARVEAVLALHERQRMMTVGCVRCNECGQEWPCPTVRALDGGQA